MIPKMAIGSSVPNWRKRGGVYCGRRGLPKEWLEVMYADYQRTGSLEKTGKLHGRTRQSMFGLFKYHGFKLNAKKFLPPVVYKGMKFTCQKTQGRHRYLRATVRNGKTEYLHHLVWEEHNGPIPSGFKVCFKDGNHLNWKLDNLELLSNADQVRKHATGHNQHTRSAQARLQLLIRGSATTSQLRKQGRPA